MNKELQNLAWRCLPKEFKEEVKKMYCTPGHSAEVYTLLQNLFGAGNLTSDAEGEEMLMCKKSKVMKLYNKFQKDGTFVSLYAAGVLDTLFGSKCLPDDTIDDTKDETKEPKPAEPEKNDSEILHVESVKETRIADEETHLRNLSQETANCDKEFDNILKDSFSKDRRLNIAAMILSGLLASGKDKHPVKRALELTESLIAEGRKGSRPKSQKN